MLSQFLIRKSVAIFLLFEAMTSKSTELKDPITFVKVDKSNVGLLKIIHHQNLPVLYSDNIYNTISREEKKTHGILAYFNNDIAVGEICFWFEPSEDNLKMYIMTIGVLETYRKRGIGTALLEEAIKMNKNNKNEKAKEIYLHVHVDNEASMSFYEKHGFQKGDLLPDYYSSLDKKGAYVFSKSLE